MERDAFTNEIRNWLQNSGAVKSLQTKLRKDLIDAISNKPEFVNGKQVGVLKPPLQDAVSKFDGTLNLFVIEHLMRRGLWYTASIMATEAEFLKDLKPPDIEEVKVMSSTDNDKSCTTPLIRHYAEKLDEMTIRSAIDNLFLRNTFQGNKDASNGNKRWSNEIAKNTFNEVINEKQLDELFRDYYRHRDNSILQLLFLLLSKKEFDKNDIVEKPNNAVDKIPDPAYNNSIYTAKSSLRRANRQRVLQRDHSNVSHENVIGESPIDENDGEAFLHEHNKPASNNKISLAEIGVQTSKEYKNLDQTRNISLKDKEHSQDEERENLDKENSEIAMLKKQLQEAKTKIKDLETEQLEIEKRREIEISSKYVPTSFRRIPEYSSQDGNFFVNSPRFLDGIVPRNGNSDLASPSNGSLDYFISGVRKKVEDLCGCNDELIRPLNELSDLGPRQNRNSSQGIKPSHQNTKQQEDERNIFNQEIEQVSKGEFKQNKSHSV